MATNSLNEKFLTRLFDVKPKKSLLAGELSDLLDMEPVSVYRRLRGDVKFTVDEIGIIASHYNISLDNIIGYVNTTNNISMRSELPIITADESFDLDYIVRRLPLLEEFIMSPGCRFGTMLNSLPRVFTNNFPPITKFMLFKWAHYTNKPQYSTYDTASVADEVREALMTEGRMLKQIEESFFIWNERIIPDVVRDIKYFASIDLMTADHLEELKTSLFDMIDYFNGCTKHGAYPETGNKFSLYLSSINIENSVSYTLTNKGPGILIYGDTLELHPATETEKRSFGVVTAWIESLKNGTVQISSNNEKERILFFKRQREAVSQL